MSTFTRGPIFGWPRRELIERDGGVTMRHDDPPSDEILGSKRHRRVKRATVEAAEQALELSNPSPDYREPRE